MEIKVKNTPSNGELLEMLQKEFPSSYTFKLFGLGKKTIMMRKSTFLGVQITIRENQISVIASPPSFWAGIFSGLAMTELGVLILPIALLSGVSPRKFRKLEKEVGLFVKERYS